MTEEQRFKVEGLSRINIEVDARDVIAEWTDVDEITVTGDRIDATIEADELFVTSDTGRGNNPGYVAIELPTRPITSAFKVQRGDLRLTNPQGRVELEDDSGDISVGQGTGTMTIASGRGDIKLSDYGGEVVVNSGSGDKKLTNVEGNLTIRSSKGDIHIAGGAGATVIASASGDIHVTGRDCDELTLAGAKGDVSISGGALGRSAISTASGDISCHADLAVDNFEFNASSGDISLAIPRDLPARVDAATTRGSITTDLPLVAIAQRGPRNPHGKRLVGSTSDSDERASITLRTSSGDIDVRWAGNTATRAPRPAPAPVTPEPSVDVNVSDSTADVLPTAHVLPPDDRKKAILSALADGSISVEEAGMLLDALERAPAAENGVKQ